MSFVEVGVLGPGTYVWRTHGLEVVPKRGTSLLTLPALPQQTVREFVPNVIEPSFGIGRILYALIEHSWYRRPGDDEARNVLAFPVVTAPFKALVTPISNNASFSPFINECASLLRRNGLSNKVDESAASIGRRYARADELGTPFAITVDFQTLKDQTVTLRERDSLKQIRESVGIPSRRLSSYSMC